MKALYLLLFPLVISCEEASDDSQKKEKVAEANAIHLTNDSIVNTYQLYPFEVGEQFIAISPLPGKINLDEDIETIQKAGITQVVCLVSKEELEARGLANFVQSFESKGIAVFQSPIVDYGLPSEQQMDSITTFLKQTTEAGENVLVHCMGGYGRSGTVMGCYAQRYVHPKDPLQYVRAVRGADAIETPEQEQFVINYK